MNKLQIRDENKVYNTVENPAAIFEVEQGILLHIGEREAIMTAYETMNKLFSAYNKTHLAHDIEYIDLPKDQTVLDNVFQKSGYIKKLHEEMTVQA